MQIPQIMVNFNVLREFQFANIIGVCCTSCTFVVGIGNNLVGEFTANHPFQVMAAQASSLLLSHILRRSRNVILFGITYARHF